MGVVVLQPEGVRLSIQAFEYFKDCDRVRRRLERMDLESKVYLLAIAKNAPECTVKEMLASFREIADEYGLDVRASNNGQLYSRLRELAERTGFFEYVKNGSKSMLQMDARLAKYLVKRITRELKNRPGIVCSSCGKPLNGEFLMHVSKGVARFYHVECFRR